LDIPNILLTINATLDLVRTLKNIDRSVNEAEFKMAIVDALEKLVEAKSGVVQQAEEIARLEGEVKRLNDAFAFRGALVTHQGFKYDAVDGEPSGRPYCPACEINHQKFFRIVQNISVNDRKCPNCKFAYGREAKFF
jgi:hypothetical protein